MKSTYYHPYNFMWKCYSKSFITIPWKFKCKSPVADLHTKVSGAYPPPNRTKFFRFYICFHQKAPVSEVGAPSNEGWCPPMENPGSTPARLTCPVQNNK